MVSPNSCVLLTTGWWKARCTRVITDCALGVDGSGSVLERRVQAIALDSEGPTAFVGTRSSVSEFSLRSNLLTADGGSFRVGDLLKNPKAAEALSFERVNLGRKLVPTRACFASSIVEFAKDRSIVDNDHIIARCIEDHKPELEGLVQDGFINCTPDALSEWVIRSTDQCMRALIAGMLKGAAADQSVPLEACDLALNIRDIDRASGSSNRFLFRSKQFSESVSFELSDLESRSYIERVDLWQTAQAKKPKLMKVAWEDVAWRPIVGGFVLIGE